MKLLLDTQAAILWGLDSPDLPLAAHNAIADPSNDVFLSAVSVWEMAIKRGLGKLPLPAPAVDMARALVAHSGFKPLEIGYEHAGAVEALPQVHRDPFDRLLVAQAKAEGMRIVSGDSVFDRYDVSRVW
jgi:PIN domain nuclease of toxin-antitoxin system